MRRRRPTTEARRAAELLRAGPYQPPAKPPAPPRNPALVDFERATVPLLSRYVTRDIDRQQLLDQLHAAARDYGVEHLVDWSEYDFDKEVSHGDA